MEFKEAVCIIACSHEIVKTFPYNREENSFLHDKIYVWQNLEKNIWIQIQFALSKFAWYSYKYINCLSGRQSALRVRKKRKGAVTNYTQTEKKGEKSNGLT